MAKRTSDSRLFRLLHLHSILRSGEAFQKTDLMERLQPSFPELNERTLLADIAFLRKLGADIPAGHKHGSFRYRRPFSFLSAAGAIDLEEVEEVLAYFRQLYRRMPLIGFLQLDRMYLALQNRASLLEGKSAEKLEFQEVLYEGDKWIGPLLKLIQQNCLLKFHYQPFGSEERERELFPLLLKEYNGRWFLLGIDPEKQRLGNFALDRITRQPVPAGRTFQPSEIPDLKEMYRHVIGVSLEGGPSQIIEAIIRKPRALYVKTKPWHQTQEVLEENEHSIRFRWQLYLNRELKTRVMEYLPEIQVLRPTSLRDWVKKALLESLQMHPADSTEMPE
jgi:predicted DNA-binding transcriptional regulator YafY